MRWIAYRISFGLSGEGDVMREWQAILEDIDQVEADMALMQAKLWRIRQAIAQYERSKVAGS